MSILTYLPKAWNSRLSPQSVELDARALGKILNLFDGGNGHGGPPPTGNSNSQRGGGRRALLDEEGELFDHVNGRLKAVGP